MLRKSLLDSLQSLDKGCERFYFILLSKNVLETFQAVRNAFGRLFRWCFKRLWGGSGGAWESFLEPWGGFGKLMGGLLAPSGRQDGPRRPPSGVKRPQEAATKPLRAGFWSPKLAPRGSKEPTRET